MEDSNSSVAIETPDTVEHDIRPLSLTPILAKVFESLMLKWVNIWIKLQIDDRQFGGMAGTVRRDGRDSSDGWQGLVLLTLWLKCSTSGMNPLMYRVIM